MYVTYLFLIGPTTCNILVVAHHQISLVNSNIRSQGHQTNLHVWPAYCNLNLKQAPFPLSCKASISKNYFKYITVSGILEYVSSVMLLCNGDKIGSRKMLCRWDSLEYQFPGLVLAFIILFFGCEDDYSRWRFLV